MNPDAPALPGPERVLQRLNDGAIDDLARIAVRWLLQRPVSSLIDPDQVARQAVAALETATSGPRTEAWLSERIALLRERVPEGNVATRVPAEVSDPLRAVVARPFTPDRPLVGRLLDHAAIEKLLRDVLVGALRSFAKKLKPPVPTGVTGGAASRGFGRLKKLSQGVGTGVRELGEGVLGSGLVTNLSDSVLGGISAEFEARAEQRIREFVNESLDLVVQQVADHLCAPEHAALYGQHRAHIVDTLLAADAAVLAGEIDKLEPEELVQTGAAVARALARREGFQGEVAAIVRAAIETTGDRSLADFLRETGLDQSDSDWESEVVVLVGERARELVATDAFTTWLSALLQP